MDFETSLALINDAMSAELDRLPNDAELALFKGAWHGQTYDATAQESGYSASYLSRIVGPKLWKDLSQALGTAVTKTSFRAALEKQYLELKQQQSATPDPTENPPAPSSPQLHPRSIDWGEAPDVSLFHGREVELKTLKQWLVDDSSSCRLVAILGIGGIGKTALTAKLLETLTEQDLSPFQYIIWRSLRNAPPISELLAELVGFVSNQQDSEPTPRRLLHWLQQSRCLIVLDNMDTVLQEGSHAGIFQPGYENYGELLHLLAETRHQSSVILTSREKLEVVGVLEGSGLSVRSLQLTGSPEAAQALIEAKQLVGTADEKRRLAESYNDNPLALKIVATSIQSLFDGAIALFLVEETLVFSGLQRLLHQQFERLSELEQTVMYWLAINREWTSIQELAKDIVPTVSKHQLLEALESLCWRSLIEGKAQRYTQQPVVMEYVTKHFIERIVAEIVHQDVSLFVRHPLIKTTVSDFVRETQLHLILEPVKTQLLSHLGSTHTVAAKLMQGVEHLRGRPSVEMGYASGNVLNLLRQLPVDLAHYDFTRLTIWHAYLKGINLQHVNFTHASFAHTAFYGAFGGIHTVAISPDNSVFAAAGTSGTIQVWQMSTGKQCLSCQGHDAWVWSIAFSPNGQWLVSGGADQTVKIWDVQTGDCLQTLKGHTNWVWSVAFSPDNNIIASGGADQIIKLWSWRDRCCLNTLVGHDDIVPSVSFSADGQHVASASMDRTVRIWSVESGQCLHCLDGTSLVWSVDFSPDSQTVAVGSIDSAVKIWNVREERCLKTLSGHANDMRLVTFSPDGQTLASADDDCKIKIWDVQSGQCLKTLPGHHNWIWSLAYSPDGQSLVSGSDDRTVKVWDTQTGHCLKTLIGYTNSVRAIAFSPDGNAIASGSNNYTVRMWDIDQGHCVKTFEGHQNWIWSVTFHPYENWMASSSTDQTVKLWDTQTTRCLRTFAGHTSTVWSIEFSPDGTLLASGSNDRTVNLWNVYTGELLTTLEHPALVRSIAFSPDGQTLISGCSDKKIWIWSIEQRKCLDVMLGHDGIVWTVASSTTAIASGSADKMVRLWDLDSRQCLKTLTGHTNWIWAVTFSPQRHLLASGSADKTVRIWDVQKGTCLHILVGHTNAVRSLTFSPQGDCLASVGEDETIKLWDVETGKCIKTFPPELPYDGMDITGAMGLTDAQKNTLKALGAVEHSSGSQSVAGMGVPELGSNPVESLHPTISTLISGNDSDANADDRGHVSDLLMLQIQLLGDLCLTYNSNRVDTLTNERSQVLLAYLLLQCRTPQSRYRVAALLNPETSDSLALKTLRKDIFNLRQGLPNPDRYLDINAKTIQWNPNADFSLDVLEFEAALQTVAQAHHGHDTKLQRLERAIALYTGDLFPSCNQEWIGQERERLRQLYFNALEELITLLQSQQQHKLAIHYAQQLLQKDRLREMMYQTLMSLYLDSGDRAAAIQTYHQCMTALREELGLDPSPEIQALYQTLLD